jgi:hypothetical protein
LRDVDVDDLHVLRRKRPAVADERDLNPLTPWDSDDRAFEEQ